MKKVVMSSEYGVSSSEMKESNRDVFAVHNNECIVMNVKTDMAHRIHLKKNFGVSPDDYAKLIRGYIKPGQIIFYKTTGFTKINDIPEYALHVVSLAAAKLFGDMAYKIYTIDNGKLELLNFN